MTIKRKQLNNELNQNLLLKDIIKELDEIKQMMEVKAVVKKRGGQIWKNEKRTRKKDN